MILLNMNHLAKGAGSEFGDSKPVKKEPAKESVTKARPEKDAEEAPKAKPVSQLKPVSL